MNVVIEDESKKNKKSKKREKKFYGKNIGR